MAVFSKPALPKIRVTTPVGGGGVSARSGDTSPSIGGVRFPGLSRIYHASIAGDAATAGPTQGISPALFTNAQVFSAHTITPGAVTVSPALFTNAQVFPAHTVSTSYTISPALFTNAQVFDAHTVSASYTISPALFTNAQVFSAHTITPGAVTIAPALFTNAQVFPAHTVALGSGDQTITAGLFTNAQVFPAHTVSTSYTISPALFTNAQVFPAHTISADYTISPALFTNAQVFPAHTVTPGAVAVSPALFTNAQVFPAATVTLDNADQTITAALFTSSQAFPPFAVDGGETLQPGKAGGAGQRYDRTETRRAYRTRRRAEREAARRSDVVPYWMAHRRYEQIIDAPLPPEVKLEAVAIVAPYIEPQAPAVAREMPKASVIDWRALQANAAAVAGLLELWQRKESLAAAQAAFDMQDDDDMTTILLLS